MGITGNPLRARSFSRLSSAAERMVSVRQRVFRTEPGSPERIAYVEALTSLVDCRSAHTIATGVDPSCVSSIGLKECRCEG